MIYNSAMENTKNCDQCDIEFSKKHNTSKKEWLTYRFCGQKCHYAWRKGKRVSPRSEFKKGEASWNRGLKGFRAGDKSHLWRGGTTTEYHKIRGSFEYREWRKKVFERDKYTCIWCGARNGLGKRVPLNADHIKPFALYPELRFDVENGRTLCVPCHRTTESYMNKDIVKLNTGFA